LAVSSASGRNVLIILRLINTARQPCSKKTEILHAKGNFNETDPRYNGKEMENDIERSSSSNGGEISVSIIYALQTAI
jgi:hypothetical protein